MPNDLKPKLLEEIKARYGSVRKLDGTQSLYEIGQRAARIYFRYSKIHGRNQTFYGLRKEDLQQLEGHPSVICFLWDGQAAPLFLPFADYEDVFRVYSPAKDGQYKVMVYPEKEGTEVYFPKAGRFNVEGNFGYEALDKTIDASKLRKTPILTHSQVQTLIGAVGIAKGFDVWIPTKDRLALDWNLTKTFGFRESLPESFASIWNILQEIDVVWLQPGSSNLTALFEVEYSTPVYSGLLRFNDIHLVAPSVISRFTVVSNDTRRALFIRQLNRPTFKASGLNDLCTFLEYADVFDWFTRLTKRKV